MTNSPKGHFIVIEGLEGAGKSTALHTIKNVLDSYNIDFMTTREPGGTVIGERLRSMIKSLDSGKTLDARTELLLLYASRVQLLQEVVYPALQDGKWVLADRFELSTYAYQGGGRQLDKTFIDCLSQYCLQGLKPDITLFLDVSPEKGLQRAQKRSQFDRIEQESLSFFDKVYERYHSLIKDLDNVVVVDANQQLSAVQKDIASVFTQYIKNHAVNVSY